MIEKLADKTYKITYLNYPDFSSMYIGSGGDCILSKGIMRPFKFNLRDFKEHEERILIGIGPELTEAVRKLIGEYV